MASAQVGRIRSR